MITQLFSCYDSAVGAYLPLFPARSKGEAIRSFQDAVTAENSRFRDHAADYTLFHVGSFCDETGALIPLEAKISLGTALEYLSKSS